MQALYGKHSNRNRTTIFPKIIALFLVSMSLFAGCDPMDPLGLSDERKDFKGDPDEIPLDSIITLSRAEDATTPIRADGTSTVTWTARIHQDADMNTITFTTTAGTFDSTASAQTINVKARPVDKPFPALEARAILRSGTKKGPVLISAAIGGYTARDTISFSRAFATAIRGETEKETFIVGDRTVLTAILSRNAGSVTQGTEVRFSAEPSSMGRFIGGATEKTARTDANGKATITFVTDIPNAKPDTIMITMKTRNANSPDSLSHMITLYTKAAN